MSYEAMGQTGNQPTNQPTQPNPTQPNPTQPNPTQPKPPTPPTPPSNDPQVTTVPLLANLFVPSVLCLVGTLGYELRRPQGLLRLRANRTTMETAPKVSMLAPDQSTSG